MKRTLLAACAAVAICGAVPVVSKPAYAQAEKSTYDLFDMLYRLVREEGVENVADMELYQNHWLELNRRMENADTAQQKAAFNDFPKPPQSVIDAYEGSSAATDGGTTSEEERRNARIADMTISAAYSDIIDQMIYDNHAETFEDTELDFETGNELQLGYEIEYAASPNGNQVDAAYEDNARGSDGSSTYGGKTDAGTASTPNRGSAWVVGSDFGGMIGEDEDIGKEPPASATGEDTTLGGPIVKDKLWFFVAASQVNIPKPGYGVEVTADDERFVTETDGTLSGTTFGGAYLGGFNVTPPSEYEGFTTLQRRWRGRANAFLTTLSYTQADGSSSGSVPAGGNGTGVVYFDFADDGATGLFYGSAGSDVETSTDYEGFRFTAGRKVYHELTSDWYWGCYHGLFYDYSDTEHEFGITTPTYSDIYTFGRQDLTERYAGIELGPFFGRKFGKVNTHVRPLLNFGYREADFDAQQDTFCGLCSTQNVPVRPEDDDSSFTYGLSLDAGLALEIAKDLDIGINYQARWRADSAAIENPESGDDLYVDNQPTRLTTEQRSEQRLIFSISKDL